MFKIAFIKMIKGGVLLVLLILFMGIFVPAQAIDIKSVLLKFSLQKGDELVKNVSLSSVSGGEVKLKLVGISGGVEIIDNNLVFDKNEEKFFQVRFDTNPLDEGVYVGHIEVTSGKEREIIPVIFEVESEDVFFDANLEIPVKYSEIAPGEKMVVQMNMFDLFSGTKNSLNTSAVDVEYTVHDLNGNNIISEHENFVVDGQVAVTKTMNFPDSIETGQYVFSAAIKYRSSVGIASEVFTISENPSPSLSEFRGLSLSNTGLILVFIAFIFLTLILFFVYIIKDRDKLLLELREYNNQELTRQKEFLNQQAAILRSKKGGDEKSIKKEIETKIEKIKTQQKKRVDELKELKKDGEIEKMRKKLDEWKRKGYNTTVMEYKLKNLSTKDMKSILEKWKEKYSS